MPNLIYSFAQLEAFTAVAEHGSLAKAALKLGNQMTDELTPYRWF